MKRERRRVASRRSVSEACPFCRRTISLLLVAIAVSVLARPAGGEPAPPRGSEGISLRSIRGSNEMIFSRDVEDTLDELENWFDVSIDMGEVTAGFRYQMYETSARGANESAGFSQRFAEFRRDWLTLRAGNYYETFGRGLVLRVFEDREIRQETSLDGVALEARLEDFMDLKMTGITGRSGDDFVRGGDVEATLLPGVKLGAAYAMSNRSYTDRTEMGGIRSDVSHGPLGVYAEFATRDGFHEFEGSGFYLSTTLSVPKLGVVAEYKDYDDFEFAYHNPPAALRDHSVNLLARHPRVVQPDDEQGFQVEATYSPSFSTTIIGSDSYTAQHSGDAPFHEQYLEIRQDIGDRLFTILAGARSREIPSGRDEANAVYRYTGAGELDFRITDERSISLIYEHQLTESAYGDVTDQYGVVGFSCCSILMFSLQAERTSEKDPVTDKDFWLMGSLGLKFARRHDVSLSVGTRRSRFICSSGMCRFEPKLEGAELRIVSTF
jgi:hypothetical protein